MTVPISHTSILIIQIARGQDLLQSPYPLETDRHCLAAPDSRVEVAFLFPLAFANSHSVGNLKC